MTNEKLPIIYVIYYSTHGHIEKMARQVVIGLQRSGVNAKLWQVAETLNKDILIKMNAPPKASDVPIITPEDLAEADGFLFGVPTRFGSVPSQIKALFDGCGQLWMKGTLHGKFAGVFFSSGSQGSGQETTALSCLPFFVHHGINFVPIGYKSGQLKDNTEVHGGSPWGSGTITGADGLRQPSDLEMKVAEFQGFEFGSLMKRVGSN
jgi:NAD(P)H dehydrogenase (quinone)